MAITITAKPEEIESSITQALEGVNNACLAMRQRGLTVILPERLDFELTIANSEAAGASTKDTSEKDAQSNSTTTYGTSTQIANKTGGGHNTTNSPNGSDRSTTSITHPAVQTAASGGDDTDERMTQDHIPKPLQPTE